MSKVAIVTDSTAVIPPEILATYPITIVPLQVIWAGQSYKDGIDLTAQEFYERLKTAKVMPSTSQPSPADFKSVYERLLAEGYDVLSIHISKKLSGTMDSAIQAKDMLPGRPIEVVDSNTTAMAMGFQALEAVRLAQKGATLQECKSLVENTTSSVGALFAVSTLEFLHRGGRIGGAAAFLGTTLGLKPLLELKDGHVEAVERVRTMSKVLDRLLDLLVEKIGNKNVRLSSLHTAMPEQGQVLLERALARIPANQVLESCVAEISPVIGTHSGPGTLGIAYLIGF